MKNQPKTSDVSFKLNSFILKTKSFTDLYEKKEKYKEAKPEQRIKK